MEGVEIRNVLLSYLSKDIAKTNIIKEDIRTIVRAKKGNKEAIKKVIENNIRLVVKFASKFRVQNDVFMDLISEGCLGIMRAIRKYDIRKGIKFSSYAIIWIKHYILTYLSESSSVKLPLRKKKILKEIDNKIEEVSDSYCADEILSEYRMSLDEYQKLCSVRNIINFSDLSDNSSVFDNLVLSDVSVEEEIEKKDIENLVREKLSKLTPKEQFILEHRYGLNNKEIMRLSQIARLLNSSPEGIRYIERNAIEKLKEMFKNEFI